MNSIKKRAKSIVDALKKSNGRNSLEVKVAEMTKRALMMLPLLPIEFITAEVVNFVIWRWRNAFPQRTDFDDLLAHLLRNYVGPNARFAPTIWCVCGCVTRTNNSAESSHALLNTSIRVSGAVPFDMFLLAIEGQMKNTAREIQMGCPSHTKSIYKRRNELLAVELSDFFNGEQGVLRYLDNCSLAMKVKNLHEIDSFLRRRANDTDNHWDGQWISTNRARVVGAALSLYRRLHPNEPKSVEGILGSVQTWAFQQERFDGNLDIVNEDSICSESGPHPSTSFLETRNRLYGDVFSMSEVYSGDIETGRPRVNQMVFEGETYKLVLQ